VFTFPNQWLQTFNIRIYHDQCAHWKKLCKESTKNYWFSSAHKKIKTLIIDLSIYWHIRAVPRKAIWANPKRAFTYDTYWPFRVLDRIQFVLSTYSFIDWCIFLVYRWFRSRQQAQKKLFTICLLFSTFSTFRR